MQLQSDWRLLDSLELEAAIAQKLIDDIIKLQGMLLYSKMEKPTVSSVLLHIAGRRTFKERMLSIGPLHETFARGAPEFYV